MKYFIALSLFIISITYYYSNYYQERNDNVIYKEYFVMDGRTQSAIIPFITSKYSTYPLSLLERLTDDPNALFEMEKRRLMEYRNQDSLTNIIKMAENNFDEAMIFLGQYYEHINPELSIFWLKKSSDTGNIAASHLLCISYATKKDFNNAFNYCNRGAKAAIPMDQALTAEMYFRGKGVSKNKKLARELFCSAKKNGRKVNFALITYGLSCNE